MSTQNLKRMIIGLLIVTGLAFLASRIAQRNVSTAPDEAGDRAASQAPSSPAPPPEGLAGATSPKAPKVAGVTTAGPGSRPAADLQPPPAPTADETAARLAPLVRAVAAVKARAAALPEAKPTSFAADRDGIKAAMRAAIPKLKDCYEPWAQLNPALAGKLNTSYAIGGEGGAPTKVHVVEGGLGNELLDGCVLSVLEQELEFEAPADGQSISVTYPLVFSQDAPTQPEN